MPSEGGKRESAGGKIMPFSGDRENAAGGGSEGPGRVKKRAKRRIWQ